MNANAGSQSTPGVTNISTMTGKILVKNGIAQTNNLQAKLDIGNVGATGTANLIDESLNMRVTAVLTQATSQKVGGNSISGFMQTALANKQGELVVPAIVTGTFSNPKFAPDVQQIAQMKVKGMVPNFSDPASVTGALQNLLGAPKNTPTGLGIPGRTTASTAEPGRSVDRALWKEEETGPSAPEVEVGGDTGAAATAGLVTRALRKAKCPPAARRNYAEPSGYAARSLCEAIASAAAAVPRNLFTAKTPSATKSASTTV